MNELAVMIAGLFLIGFALAGRKRAPFSSWGLTAVGIGLIVVASVAMLDGVN